MSFLVVSSELFSQMQSYKTLEVNQKERQQMKFSFIDRIKKVVSNIRWDRAEKLQQVIDEIIYKATDRGYSFNGRETLANKCNVSLRTVDKAINILKQSNEVVVAYRHNPNSNGYKTPIFFLKNHENFSYWNELLNLEDSIECEVGSSGIPTGGKGESTKKLSTYSLPDINNNNIHSNVQALEKENTQLNFIKYVPKEINRLYIGVFGQHLHNIWLKVVQAFKTINTSVLDRETILRVGGKVIQNLYTKMTQKDLSKDEALAYVFKACLNGFYNLLGDLHLKDLKERNTNEYERIYGKAMGRVIAQRIEQRRKL